MPEVLRTVTDRFCLYKNAREGRQNGRNYVLSAVRSMLESKDTQEGLRLGEHFGYYGHGRREMTKKLDVPETSVIMVEGKPVVIDNVPGCRTVSVSVDENGVVTHTQEIFNTEPGKIIAAMIDSAAGGWSWATGGRMAGSTAITTSFHGFDYVTNPNYVSLDHPASAGLFESADAQSLLAESLENVGYSASAAGEIITHYGKMAELEMMIEATQRNAELEQQLLESHGRMLELQHNEQTLRDRIALLESASGTRDEVMTGIMAKLDDLPVFVTRAQREAFRFRNAGDADIVGGLFESLMKVHARSLPLPSVEALTPANTAGNKTAPPSISFNGDKNPFMTR